MTELETVREELAQAREELWALERSGMEPEGSRAALEGLRREVDELREAHAKATSEREQYRALYMRLLERCRVLERGIIAGKKAERFDGEDAGQLSMQLLGMLRAEGEAPAEELADAGEDDLDLDDLEDDDDDELAGTDAPGDACAPRRRRRGRRKLPEALPRVEIEVLPPEVIQEGLDPFERIGEVASEAGRWRSGRSPTKRSATSTATTSRSSHPSAGSRGRAVVRTSLVLLLGALAGACAAASNAEVPPARVEAEPRTEAAPASAGVSARAHLDKERYRVGETIQLTVELHSEAPRPITLVHPDYWGVSEIRVFDAEGQPVEPTSTYKAGRKAVQETLTLDPGGVASHTFEDLTTYTCCYAYTFRSLPAGRYAVAVELTNPPVRSDAPPGWPGEWEGHLTTPRVAFTVGR